MGGFVGVNGVERASMPGVEGIEDMGFELELELEEAGGPIEEVVPLLLGFTGLAVVCGVGGT